MVIVSGMLQHSLEGEGRGVGHSFCYAGFFDPKPELFIDGYDQGASAGLYLWKNGGYEYMSRSGLFQCRIARVLHR